MLNDETIQDARRALDSASSTLSNPQGGSFENANALALIGIGRALVAIAEEIREARTQSD